MTSMWGRQTTDQQNSGVQVLTCIPCQKETLNLSTGEAMPGRARSGGRCLISSKGQSHSLISRLEVMEPGMTTIRRRRRLRSRKAHCWKAVYEHSEAGFCSIILIEKLLHRCWAAWMGDYHCVGTWHHQSSSPTSHYSSQIYMLSLRYLINVLLWSCACMRLFV